MAILAPGHVAKRDISCTRQDVLGKASWLAHGVSSFVHRTDLEQGLELPQIEEAVAQELDHATCQ